MIRIFSLMAKSLLKFRQINMKRKPKKKRHEIRHIVSMRWSSTVNREVINVLGRFSMSLPIQRIYICIHNLEQRRLQINQRNVFFIFNSIIFRCESFVCYSLDLFVEASHFSVLFAKEKFYFRFFIFEFLPTKNRKDFVAVVR